MALYSEKELREKCQCHHSRRVHGVTRLSYGTGCCKKCKGWKCIAFEKVVSQPATRK